MSEAIWRGLAEKALKGGSLDALSSVTGDGIAIAPLHARAKTRGPRARRQIAGAWSIAQRVDNRDATEANRLALIDLEGGANALTLVFEGGAARGYGLEANADTLATALGGIELDYISMRLDAGSRTIDVARALAGLSTSRRLTSAALAVDLGFDPIGGLARTGKAEPVLAPEDLRAFVMANRAAGLAGRGFLADGRTYHEAGAGEAQELAAVLATAVSYLRQLERAGFALADASASIAFLLVSDADTFLSIAKFRALRLLWARVEQACGLTPQPTRLHAETAWRMMTRHDPWVNVMRVTAAVFAAGIGGADVITTLPYTLALGLPDDGARRLARNTQLVLLEESHLALVEDPAAGSGGLEGLTDALCEKAWVLFQQIEHEGGIEASLGGCLLQARVATTADKRLKTFATLENGLTGTSTFPPLDEAPSPLATATPMAEPAHGPLALPSVRDAIPFEILRDRAAAIEVAGGATPMIALATLGLPVVHGPRATYAANFFAAGGLNATTFDADGDLVGFDPVTMPVVCICASDALYQARLAETVAKVRAAGARFILLAGTARVADAAGTRLDGFIHRGCNALQVLDETLRRFSSIT